MCCHSNYPIFLAFYDVRQKRLDNEANIKSIFSDSEQENAEYDCILS